MKSNYQRTQFNSRSAPPVNVCGKQFSPDFIYVACNESVGAVQQRSIDFGYVISNSKILSPFDTPALRSSGAIFNAIPPSTRSVAIVGIDYLLPVENRTPENVMRVLAELHALGAARGIKVFTTSEIDPRRQAVAEETR